MNTTNPPTLYQVLSQKYDTRFFETQTQPLKGKLDSEGILVLDNFISPSALDALIKEANSLEQYAYASDSSYNVYVLPEDTSFPPDSPRNKLFKTTKKCIPDDQVPSDSLLRTLYDSHVFRKFLSELVGLEEIFPYADPLSSININYYKKGDSLEWHFDNAEFVVTLLLQRCISGGEYEYFTNMRYTPDGAENYELVDKCIRGEVTPSRKNVPAGSLMIFRGTKSLHRVTEIIEGERILVTFNYNPRPDISLSETSRMTFFGRTK